MSILKSYNENMRLGSSLFKLRTLLLVSTTFVIFLLFSFLNGGENRSNIRIIHEKIDTPCKQQIKEDLKDDVSKHKILQMSQKRNDFHGCGDECTQLMNIQKHVDCAAMMEGDTVALKMAQQYMKFHPKTVTPDRVRSYSYHDDCAIYKDNPLYHKEPNSGEEANFPIGYSIVVHKDPVQLERLFRTIYWPQNVYCIHVDSKSKSDLIGYVKHLSKCFSNVIMTKQEDITYAGFSRLQADLNCMEDLLNYPKKWKYVINLTGQEFPLKTNREIVRILQIYNGSNDIEGLSKHSTGGFKNRFSGTWQETINHKMVQKKEDVSAPPPHNITLMKGSAYGVFSREFVHFLFSNSKVKDFIAWLKHTWSPDEFIWSTLNARLYNPQLNTPGGYDSVPERKPWLAKYASWPPRDKCASKAVRGICIFTSGDLPVLIGRRELFANKFYIERDYLVLHCLEEWLHNKTVNYLPSDFQFYRNLPFVMKNKS